MGEERREYKKNKWVQSQVFETAREEEDFFQNEPHWQKETRTADSSGVKIRFYCNAVSKRKGARCPAEVYIHKLNNSVKNILYRNGEEHQHEDRVPTRNSLPPATRDRIRTLWSTNTSPRLISHDLRENNEIAVKPSINQVVI